MIFARVQRGAIVEVGHSHSLPATKQKLSLVCGLIFRWWWEDMECVGEKSLSLLSRGGFTCVWDTWALVGCSSLSPRARRGRRCVCVCVLGLRGRGRPRVSKLKAHRCEILQSFAGFPWLSFAFLSLSLHIPPAAAAAAALSAAVCAPKKPSVSTLYFYIFFFAF